MAEWFEVARSRIVVRRALVSAVVVGALLIGINHGEALLQGDIDGTRLFKMVLTVIVPYMVSTVSSIAAMRTACWDDD